MHTRSETASNTESVPVSEPARVVRQGQEEGGAVRQENERQNASGVQQQVPQHDEATEVSRNEVAHGSPNRRRGNRDSTSHRFDRQQQVIFIRERLEPAVIGIIGLGNIGSHTALSLARVGIEVIHLYDSDRVELHNTASQSYSEQDIGKYKVEVVREQIKAINPQTIVYVHGNATIRKPEWVSVNDYLIVAVDTMDMRKRLYHVLQTYGARYHRRIQRVVDVRVGGEQIDVFNTHRVFCRGTIRADADTEACGAEFFAYVSSMAGALGAKEIIDCIHNESLTDATSRLPHTKSYSIDVRNMVIVKDV